MSTTRALHYNIPVHNERAVLENTIQKVGVVNQKYPGSSITLVENGSTDNSWEICQSAVTSHKDIDVHAIQLKVAGLGYALRAGFENILTHAKDTDYGVFVGCDFPFRFSDLDAILKLHSLEKNCVFVGSKAHPQSQLEVTTLRRFLSKCFLAVRYVFLSMKTEDPQGSLFIPVWVLRDHLHKVKANDFFFTTELLYYIEKAGIPVVELPIQMADTSHRPSSVRIFRDSYRILKATIKLGFRG